MKKMTDKHKIMAWLLNKQFNYPVVAIAQLMQVSKNNIYEAIKEMNFECE
ncbi:MAG: hypothetical protein K2G63_05605 [Oscillospiraceae bacterium]|nr:hypothetical protein [Oscillospiraceae bacterium]